MLSRHPARGFSHLAVTPAENTEQNLVVSANVLQLPYVAANCAQLKSRQGQIRTGVTAAEAQVSAVWQVGGKLAAATPSQFIPCSPAIIEWIAKQATEAYPKPLLRSNMVINYIQEIKREHARILLQACSPFARSFAGVLAAPAAP